MTCLKLHLFCIALRGRQTGLAILPLGHAQEGVRVRVGRWKIKGEPTAVLVDFSSLIPRKDEILKSLWESYHVDSISGQWDYIEPVLFGWAAGVVIASYVETFCAPTDKAAAHFHEWMTAAGGLYARMWADYNRAVQWKITSEG